MYCKLFTHVAIEFYTSIPDICQWPDGDLPMPGRALDDACFKHPQITLQSPEDYVTTYVEIFVRSQNFGEIHWCLKILQRPEEMWLGLFDFVRPWNTLNIPNLTLTFSCSYRSLPTGCFHTYCVNVFDVLKPEKHSKFIPLIDFVN